MANSSLPRESLISRFSRTAQHCAVLHLFRCYGQTGDLGALIREERQLRQALLRDYGNPDDPDEDKDGCEPAADTTALLRQVCAEPKGRSRDSERIA